MATKKVIAADELQVLIANKIIQDHRNTGKWNLTYNDARNLVLGELDSVEPVEVVSVEQMLVNP